MYKALITDLDGSAVHIGSDGKDVDEQTRAAVRLAQAAGYRIACASGRSWRSAKPVVTALGITSLCIVNGGSAIIDPTTEEMVWEKPLAEESIQGLFAIYKRLATKGEFLTPAHRMPITDITEVPTAVRYMYLLNVPTEEGLVIVEAINSSGLAVAHHTPSWKGGGMLDIHATHPEATKEHALKVWQQMTGISKAETIAMGDSGNDVPLFKSAGLKVATGNATDDLKPHADYIAPSVTEHALKHVIDKFLLSQA
jgi:hydroxymethylpyrimidine pyrophosphatase-like HAD family hydrolase